MLQPVNSKARKSTIAVAMSGGVDSSAAAALLAAQHPIVGLTMQLWDQRRSASAAGEDAGGRCCSLNDVYDARRVAEFLGIPYYVVNFERRFETDVVRPFVEQYLAGETPIPCSLCNTEIKFDQLITTALGIGTERVATGHYARVQYDSSARRYRLFRALDESKDQSYFLFGLTQEQLARSLFPLGEMTKGQVRAFAASRGLPVAKKAESQEICFVPSGNYVRFIESYLADKGQKIGEKGPIVARNGEVVGQHQGVHHYTVGQRKGLGLAVGHPLYVLEIDAPRNSVVVGEQQDLYRRHLLAKEVNWMIPKPSQAGVEVSVKIRHAHRPAAARVRPREDGSANVEFAQPQRAITPGQAVVFYRNQEVLGGGWVSKVLPR